MMRYTQVCQVYKTNLIPIIADNDRLGKISAKSINLIYRDFAELFPQLYI